MNKNEIKNRLIKKRIILSNECWISNGWIDKNGSAFIYIDNRNHLLSRASAYAYLDFDLTNSKLILHKCKTKGCFNPAHIYVGNTSDNNNDAVRDGTYKNQNARKKYCKHGHLLEGDNLYRWFDKKAKKVHRWCRICRNNADKKFRFKDNL